MKKIILAALMFTVTTALSGCGSSPSGVPAAIAPTPVPAAAKQVSVDVTRDFWGVSAVKLAVTTDTTTVQVTTATVTAGGVNMPYDVATASYLKSSTVAKAAAQVQAKDATAAADPQYAVDISLDSVVTVTADGQPVTGAVVTINGAALAFYTGHAYASNPPAAPYVLASIYSYQGMATEMSVYTTDYLGGPENLTANMGFNSNHLGFCGTAYALGGVPMGELTDYENSLNAPIPAGTTVNFSGTVAGTAISASAVMPTAPAITGAALNQNPAVWSSTSANTIHWSGASPINAGTSFKLVVKTPMSLGGLFLGPIFNPVEYPVLTNTVISSSATSFTIPANTLPPGIFALYLGLQTTDAGRLPIANSDPSGGLQIQVYGTPLTVTVQ